MIRNKPFIYIFFITWVIFIPHQLEAQRYVNVIPNATLYNGLTEANNNDFKVSAIIGSSITGKNSNSTFKNFLGFSRFTFKFSEQQEDTVIEISNNIEVFPDTLNLGDVSIGQSRSGMFWVRNTTDHSLNVDLTIGNMQFFGIDPPIGSIAPMDSIQITVTFTPSSEGFRSATATIQANDSSMSINKITVTGFGGLQPYGQIDLVLVEGKRQVSPITALRDQSIQFLGSGADTDESGSRIVSHRWYYKSMNRSFQDSVFFYELAQFDLPEDFFPVGQYRIFYQVVDDEGQTSAPDSVILNIQREFGRAIIVAGEGFLNEQQNTFFGYITSATNEVYNLLAVQKGFRPEGVEYLNPVAEWSDSLIQVDNTNVSSKSLEQAIERVASSNIEDGTPLLIYLAGHGSREGFAINEFTPIAGEQLGAWLDDLVERKKQTGRPINHEEIVVVVDFCFSRNFLDGIVGLGRMVIGTTNESPVWISKYEDSFSAAFFDEIANNKSILTAFDAGKALLVPGQEPQLDANGDRIYNTEEDRRLANQVYIGPGSLPRGGKITRRTLLIEGLDVIFEMAGSRSLDPWFRIIPPLYDPMTLPFDELPYGRLELAEEFADSVIYRGIYTVASDETKIWNGSVGLVGGTDLSIDDLVPHELVGRIRFGLSADFNNDGQIDFADFFLFVDQFGTTEEDDNWDPRYDLEINRSIDFQDFFVFSDQFGSARKAKLVALAQDYIGLQTSSSLAQNYPNPFNASTTISYFLTQRGYIRLYIYDILGQSVRNLMHSSHEIGSYDVMWDSLDDGGEPVASGIYFLRIESSHFVKTKKMLLLR